MDAILNLLIQLEKVNLTLFKFSQDASACATHDSVPLGLDSQGLRYCYFHYFSISSIIIKQWNMLSEEIAEENDFTVFESKFENVFKN